MDGKSSVIGEVSFGDVGVDGKHIADSADPSRGGVGIECRIIAIEASVVSGSQGRSRRVRTNGPRAEPYPQGV